MTRASCHVDRTACAWMIRRFIDPGASFLLVTDPDGLPPNATPLDVLGHPFSHHDGQCTYEVMIRRLRLSAAGFDDLSRIVHEADLGDERYDAPETVGLSAIVSGMREMLDDDALLAATYPIYDGLLAQLASRRG